MVKKRRRFSRECKLEAVALVTEGGLSISQAARDLGIRDSVLNRWKKAFESDPDQAFPGQGSLKPLLDQSVAETKIWTFRPVCCSRRKNPSTS
jgi:transposase-like protein